VVLISYCTTDPRHVRRVSHLGNILSSIGYLVVLDSWQPSTAPWSRLLARLLDSNVTKIIAIDRCARTPTSCWDHGQYEIHVANDSRQTFITLSAGATACEAISALSSLRLLRRHYSDMVNGLHKLSLEAPVSAQIKAERLLQAEYERLLDPSQDTDLIPLVFDSASGLTGVPTALRAHTVEVVVIETWGPALPPDCDEADLLRWEEMRPPRWKGLRLLLRHMQGKAAIDVPQQASSVLLV